MNNNNSSNFGSYTGIAVALGGLAAIGTMLYNEYQEQQNRNRHNYGTSGNRRVEEQEERRRNLRILDMENERLLARMEEERVRRIQEERERRRMEAQRSMEQNIEAQRRREKEQEEKKRREEEILRFKTNELAKIDDEFDKFFDAKAEFSDESDCFVDEINPNRRIKEKFRKTRQQEKEQRDLQRQSDAGLHREPDQEPEISDQRKTQVSEINLMDDACGATSLEFLGSASTHDVETKKEQNNANNTGIAKQ